MSFVNERMTKEEVDEFKAKSIPNPGYKRSVLTPHMWTIDREENVAFIWALQDREDPDQYYFLLYWKDSPIPVQLRESWRPDSLRIWSCLYLKIPENLKDKQSEIVQSLKEALAVYKYNGNPNFSLNKTVKVQCNF